MTPIRKYGEILVFKPIGTCRESLYCVIERVPQKLSKKGLELIIDHASLHIPHEKDAPLKIYQHEKGAFVAISLRSWGDTHINIWGSSETRLAATSDILSMIEELGYSSYSENFEKEL